MDTTSETREMAERFLAAANAHDIEGMVSFWESGAVETFPTFGETYRVPDEFASNFESLFEAVPDVSWEIVSVTADPDRAVVRSRMSGPTSAPTKESPPPVGTSPWRRSISSRSEMARSSTMMSYSTDSRCSDNWACCRPRGRDASAPCRKVSTP